MQSDKEQYACFNCGNYGPLTIHGRCEYCNSEAVALAIPNPTRHQIIQPRQQTETLTEWALRIVDTCLAPKRSN